MVFASVLVDVLNRFLEPYVERLDSSHLKVGIWNGNVKLDNIQLKKDLFKEFDLPIRVKASHIGNIEMKIPWKNLTSEVIVVTIDEIYIVVEPDLNRPYNAEEDEARQRKKKEDEIKKLEEAAKKLKAEQKKKLKKGKKDEKAAEKPDTFTEKLVSHLIKNLVVKIRDVHVRYEDTVTNPTTTAMGITLHSLELKSTDGNWKQCVSREAATLIYKLVELNSLGVYFNTFAQGLGSLPEEQMLHAMRDQIARPGQDPPPVNTYLLHPVSALARVKVNLRPGVSLDIPQLFASLECEHISITFMEKQFKSLMITLDAFGRHASRQKYLKYRPTQPLKENRRAWWLFAYNAVLEETVRRKLNMWSWQHIKEHRMRCRQYTNKYYEKLSSLNTSSSLLKEISKLETQLDVFNVMMCRKIAKRLKKKQLKPVQMVEYKSSPVHPVTSASGAASGGPTPTSSLDSGTSSLTREVEGVTRVVVTDKKKQKEQAKQVKLEREKAEKEAKKLAKAAAKEAKEKEKGDKKGFFSRFKKSLKPAEKGSIRSALAEGGATGVVVASPAIVVEETEHEKARQKFYQDIGYAEDEEYYEFPKEYVAYHIGVSLTKVTLELAGESTTLANLATNDVKATVRVRPSTKAVSVQASVGGISMTGIPHNGVDTRMVTAGVGGREEEDGPLVDFSLELNPLERENMDIVVCANVRPLQIIYDEDTVDGLIAAFRVRKNLHLQELTSAASATMGQLKEQTTSGLQDAIQDRKQMEINVKVRSPYIIVPEKGFYSSEHHLLIVDLGELALTGSTKDPRTLAKELTDKTTMDRYYDSFAIELSNLQVLVAKPDENWQLARVQGISPLHLLEPTGLTVTLQKSIITDDALIPSLRIDGDIEGFEVHLDDVQLRTLLKIVSTLKLPPPALANTTTYYNELPPPPAVQAASGLPFDDHAQLVKAVSLDTMTVTSFGDDDDEELEEEEGFDEERSFSSPDRSSDQSDKDDEDMSRIVFTDVSVKLVIRKIGVTVTQLLKDKEKTLLTVAVSRIEANVQDRQWDTQGSVAIHNITVLDYITTDARGQPTYLLKTAGLADGNFISARFVSITDVGKDFALKYTGLQNSASVQLSLVQVELQQGTIAGLIAFALSLKPALDQPAPPTVSMSTVSTATLKPGSLGPMTPDKEVAKIPAAVPVAKPPSKEFHIEAKFEGIDVTVGHLNDTLLHSKVAGFSVTADLGAQVTKISASVQDLLVENPDPQAVVKHIVSKADTDENIIALEVKVYPGGTSGENMHDLEKVDAAVSAKLHRIVAHLDTGFLTNMLEFLQKLKIDSQAMVAAYSATAGTATATANALKDTPVVRVLLDVAIHAPLIKIPYSSQAESGTLQVDLGVFSIRNRFVHGYETSNTRGSVVDIGTAQAILDRISVQCSSLQIYRTHVSPRVKRDTLIRTDILEPLDFDIVVTRNLTPQQSTFFPEVNVVFELDRAVKFFLASEDIQALITIILATTKISDVLAPSQQPVRARSASKPPKPAAGTTLTVSPIKPHRLSSFDPDKIVKVNLRVRIQSVSLELSSSSSPILLASTSGLTATMRMNPNKLTLRTGVEKLSIVDLDSDQLQSYCQVLSFTQGKDKVVSAEVEVPLDSKKKDLSPVATIRLNVSQFQLLLTPSFIGRILEFVLALDINPDLVKNATKVAQDSASAATELVQDVYAKITVSVHAPVVLFPIIQEGNDLQQAFMVDLGLVHVENQITNVEKNVAYESYGIALSEFKASRVLLKGVEHNVVIVAERILIQPYSMLVNLDRNLCSWYTQIPLVSVEAQLGTFKVLLGQEDLETGLKYGVALAELLLPLLPKDDRQAAVAGAIMEGLTYKDDDVEECALPVVVVVEETETVDRYKKFSISVVLSEFALQLFKNEPSLSIEGPSPQILGDSCGLAGFQLVAAKVATEVYSNDDVELKASINDMALLDLQEERQDRNTGNRVIQHYTSNPLSAYTGRIDKPIFGVEYVLQNQEHFILLKIRDILVITDINFIENVANYFKALFADVKLPQLQNNKDDQQPVKELEDGKKKQEKEGRKLNIPTIKVDANIQDVRVALIETVESPEPQALTLKLSTYLHLQLSSETNSKRVSLNMADVSIMTSSFYNLNKITSAVLLPFSMTLAASGPLDKSAMVVNGTVEPVTLKLSPPIIRLIIHAVQTLLLSAEKPKPPPAPADLWQKKPILQDKLWYLLPVPLHRGVSTDEVTSEEQSSEEMLTLSLEGLELILENEGTEQCPATPVLAFNATAVVQMFDWTGKLSVSSDFQCEASYFNEQLSVWEPLLEPLELTNGKLQPWNLHAEVTGNFMNEDSRKSGPKVTVSLAATDPLQITVTRSSLQLIKDLATDCMKEYGKKVEGLVNVKSLTGSPFTVVNKLGPTLSLYVKPAATLTLSKGKEFIKLDDGEKADLYFKRPATRVSYASVVTQSEEKEHYVDFSIGKEYRNISGVPVNSPGLYYHELAAKDASLGPQTGLVVEVAVTGAKKTITVRSPVQVKNHLSIPIRLLQTPPTPKAKPSPLTVVEPGDMYPVPFGIAFTAELNIVPADMQLEAVSSGFMWQSTQKVIETKCVRGDYSGAYYTRVITKEESFKVEKGLPEGVFAHHVFHVHAPAVVQNLLPVSIMVEAEDGSLDAFFLKSGESYEFNQFSVTSPPVLIVEIPEEKMSGKLILSPEFPDHSSFIVGKDRSTVELEVLHEDLGYHRLNIYCPYWMINKTGLTLQYKDTKSGKVSRHPPSENIQLLSCGEHKIRLSAITTRDSVTEWSKHLPLKAVGDSFLVTTRLNEAKYNFGVTIKLSKFTLSKLIVVTPYYLIANQSNTDLKVWEEGSSRHIDLPQGELIPFWPLLDSNRMHISADNCDSVFFNYKTSDSIVLQLKGKTKAVCVEVQETQSSTVVTFSSYYDGCAPVQVINLFPDLTLRFRQESKDPFPWYDVGPGESLMYTWDDPCAKRELRWEIKDGKMSSSVVDVAKDGQDSFKLTIPQGVTSPIFHSLQLPPSKTPSSSDTTASVSAAVSPSLAVPKEDLWLSIQADCTESLVAIERSDMQQKPGSSSPQVVKGYWKSFIDGLQRVLVFTRDEEVLDQIVAADSVSQNNVDVSLSLKSVGVSLVDNKRKREVAFIGITQTGVIWQVARKRGLWKTLNNTVIAHLEDAYQRQQPDVNIKNLVVNLEAMKMFSPLEGELRRTNYQGVEVSFGLSDKDYSLNAKIGYVQVDNQLPFAVYPQMFYPVPPPPTVASTAEPKPFIEASIILRKTDQPYVNHFKYVHVLIQKMALNVDVGFILALAEFAPTDSSRLLDAEYVESDVEYSAKSLQEIILPVASDEAAKRNFFDAFHLSPIKITLSLNVRGVGRNLSSSEQSVGDRFLYLLLHSLGVILTSVQEAEISFSLFHLEYQVVTFMKLKDLFVKHYVGQGIAQAHKIILGLDVLGNPVKVVRGVVVGTVDLFYEPIKGSVLGPGEFAEGLGLGLKSFFGGTFGGLTGAGARITGAFGDVFAKLTFDDEFIDRRQQEKVKSNKLGSKAFGFLKNVAEGVTGVVTQPVKGIKQEGAVGLLKGTGKGLVGLLVRPAGGLIDLTSGTLAFVTRKTQVGNIDIVQIRPPRFIGRDGVVRPFSPYKAIGNALLVGTNEGVYVESDCYVEHSELSEKPLRFLMVTDRHFMILEPASILGGWKTGKKLSFKHFTKPAVQSNNIVYCSTDNPNKYQRDSQLTLPTAKQAEEVVVFINKGYELYKNR